MSRAVFVGGYSSGKRTVEKVGGAFQSYFEDIDPFTFSDYIKRPQKVLRAAKGVPLFTHSAGAFSLLEAESTSAYLINPPLPKHLSDIIFNSLVRSVQMRQSGIKEETQKSAELARSSVIELLFHPIANIGQLPNIFRFNAIKAAIEATERGVATELIWTTGDHLYQPPEVHKNMAEWHGVPVTTLEGQHSEVTMRPEEFLAQLFSSFTVPEQS